MHSKKGLTERDICTKYITPAVEKTGWNIKTQIREEGSFTDRRLIVQGKMHIQGKRKSRFFLCHNPNLQIAKVFILIYTDRITKLN